MRSFDRDGRQMAAQRRKTPSWVAFMYTLLALAVAAIVTYFAMKAK